LTTLLVEHWPNNWTPGQAPSHKSLITCCAYVVRHQFFSVIGVNVWKTAARTQWTNIVHCRPPRGRTRPEVVK